MCIINNQIPLKVNLHTQKDIIHSRRKITIKTMGNVYALNSSFHHSYISVHRYKQKMFLNKLFKQVIREKSVINNEKILKTVFSQIITTNKFKANTGFNTNPFVYKKFQRNSLKIY